MRYTYFLSLIIFLTGQVLGQTHDAGEFKPIILGAIEELYSVELSEIRELNIYLPPGYNPQDTVKYPVIYLLDGSLDEDFIHIVGLVQFNTLEWIDQLPKSIVVGITNVDRVRDFTFPTTVPTEKERAPTSGHSQKFISFIENELQPFIEEKYHVSKDKTIIGQSLGGLLATEILLNRPHFFNRYIIVSPSLWWSEGAILDNPFKKIQEKDKGRIDIYIGVGKEGLTPTTKPRVMEVDANVLADKLKALENENISVFFDYLPQENHATIMHQAVANAIRLFNKKSNE